MDISDFQTHQIQHCAPSPRRRLPFWALGLYFPLLLIYLEGVLHLVVGSTLIYFPLCLLFSVSMGCLLGLIPLLCSPKAGRRLAMVLSLVLSLLFSVELLARRILQSYYPLSTLSTAAENRLTDYWAVLPPALWGAAPLLLLFLLPTLLLCLLSGQILAQQRASHRSAAVFAAGAVLFHLLALAAVHASWSGDITPKQLYHTDTNLDDQVEQLGLVTMLRLDVKHMPFPAKAGLDSDFDGLSGLDGSGDGSGGDTSALEEQPVIDSNQFYYVLSC